MAHLFLEQHQLHFIHIIIHLLPGHKDKASVLSLLWDSNSFITPEVHRSEESINKCSDFRIQLLFLVWIFTNQFIYFRLRQFLLAQTNSMLAFILLTFVTPLIMFSMWLHTVLTTASSLCLPNHFSTMTVLLPTMVMSTAKWRKVLVKVPRGPLMITFLALTLADTANSTLQINRNKCVIFINFYLHQSNKSQLHSDC